MLETPQLMNPQKPPLPPDSLLMTYRVERNDARVMLILDIFHVKRSYDLGRSFSPPNSKIHQPHPLDAGCR